MFFMYIHIFNKLKNIGEEKIIIIIDKFEKNENYEIKL